LVQKKAIRLVCNAHYLSHVNPLAKKLDVLLLPELYTLRCATNMYKVVNNLNLLSSLDCFKRTASPYATTHASYLLARPHSRTVVRQASVVINSISIWNNLTPDIALLPTLGHFKLAMCNKLTNLYI
jgi:hypothetical protein